jgi:hypothetical protein
MNLPLFPRLPLKSVLHGDNGSAFNAAKVLAMLN